MNGISTAYKILLLQLGATVLIAIFFAFASGTDAALAALTGGTISVITTFFFAQQVFAGGVSAARTVMRRFYFAEGVKIVLTVGLFLLALLVLKLSFLPLLLGYGVTLAVYWAALLLPTTQAAH